ncbi:cobyrinate a,c-diamide synthase [Hyphomicrobium sp.]|uniref:cobyrinate a,c-diamide synthase n=1 Tax=Hyphomicrobium sp. TaxID=82 RepID=UPI002C9C6941|nr:cobyrinate a,c-diamide synthase [Hyphomicrobium sp.]HVZ03351.1 cobyrinate a,c-diamide synthase [Hyphomicrobium sp.]
MAEASLLPPGLVIGAPRSGSGKTTVTLGLLRALKRRDHVVQPFKCGPDYIDPAFHAAAAGRASYNIDSWTMRWRLASELLVRASERTDIVIAEGLMGLFDGVMQPGCWGNGASADLAAAVGWPVVLVLDVSGQSQTAAAVARGFQNFRSGVNIAGVILNRVGSPRHVRFVTEALSDTGLTVVGALPREANLVLPERHLGLVQAEETSELESRLDTLADFVETHIDIDRLVQLAEPGSLKFAADANIRPPGQRIALARDAAFSFVYPHLLRAWRAAGAEIILFSPLVDEAPDPAADIAWLPGGYPELYAGRLAAAQQFKSALRKFAESKPVHGECGGYMTLGAGIVDADGHRHEMLGLLGLETSYASRKLNLGYRKAELLETCALGRAGDTLTGHEFHYARIISTPDAPLFKLQDSDGNVLSEGGSRRGLTTGSFFHLIDREPQARNSSSSC